MRLADVVAAGVPSIYAQIALVIFFVTFVAAVAVALSRANRERYERAARLPLDDGMTTPASEASR